MPRARRCLGTLALLLAAGLPAADAARADPWESAQRIEQRAREYLSAQARTLAVAPTITITPLDPRLRVRRCTQPLTAEAPAGSRALGATTVIVRCPGGDRPWSIHVSANVQVAVDAVVLARGVARGTVLTRADLALQRMDLASLPPGALTDPAQAAGRLLKRPLAPGLVLTAAMLEDRPLVRRGDTVMLLARAGGLDVRVKAEALGSGAAGQRIKVRNLSSRQVIEATVVAESLVQVPL